MPAKISEFSSVEPDTDKCCTEEIISDLSRCSRNNRQCKYGLPAGTTSTYCLHPDFRKFLVLSPDAVKGAAGAGRKKQNT